MAAPVDECHATLERILTDTVSARPAPQPEHELASRSRSTGHNEEVGPAHLRSMWGICNLFTNIVSGVIVSPHGDSDSLPEISVILVAHSSHSQTNSNRRTGFPGFESMADGVLVRLRCRRQKVSPAGGSETVRHRANL